MFVLRINICGENRQLLKATKSCKLALSYFKLKSIIMKYIAIYNYGDSVIKSDLNSVFSLPGNFYTFSIDNSLDIDTQLGVQYYDKNKIATQFKLNYLQLVNIERLNGSVNHPPQFFFSIYDHQTDSIIKKLHQAQFEDALSFIVQTIIRASQFPSWDAYTTSTKAEKFKSEIDDLKLQLQKEKEENRKLTSELSDFKKHGS